MRIRGEVVVEQRPSNQYNFGDPEIREAIADELQKKNQGYKKSRGI